MTALPNLDNQASKRPRLSNELREKKNRLFRARARFTPADYERLIAPFQGTGYEIVTLRDVFTDASLRGRKLFSLRHDVDHDWESALRIAAWEHARGYRSTYCVLHTDWYYGEFHEGRYVHYEEFIDFCKQLEQMGHEINLHNNFVTLALQTGHDLTSMIADELVSLRGHGLNIIGTSTHGDALCDKLGFYNLEAFEGRAWESKGGARPISFEGTTVQLGSVPMEPLGLVYEAYDYPRDVYITDSGGRLRLRRNTRGLRGYRRNDDKVEIPSASNCGLLTHPIWWDFEEPQTVTYSGIADKMLKLSALDQSVLSGESPHDRPPFHRPPASTGSFEEPPLHRELLDHILYLDPAALQPRRVRPLFVDDDDYTAFLAAWRQYENSFSHEARQGALRAYMLARPNPDLILEFHTRNLGGLTTGSVQDGTIDFSAFGAALLTLAAAYSETRDSRFLDAASLAAATLLQSEASPCRQDEGSPSTIGALGRLAYPSLKLALIVRDDGLSRYPLIHRLSETMRDRVLTLSAGIEVGDAASLCGSSDDMSAFACALLMAAAHVRDPALRERVKKLWDFLAESDGTQQSASSAIWLAFLASECLEHHLATDPGVVNQIAESVLLPELDALTRHGSPEGLTHLLAWGQFVRSEPSLSAKLEQLALEPELGNWFRHPWGVLAYANRLATQSATELGHSDSENEGPSSPPGRRP